jgi:hypothetical protein
VPDERAAARFDAALGERYEELRAAALGGRADGWRLGLGVLAGKGVAAWISAWTACPHPAPVPAPSAPGPGSSSPVGRPAASGPDGAQMVRVLAAMALAHA